MSAVAARLPITEHTITLKNGRKLSYKQMSCQFFDEKSNLTIVLIHPFPFNGTIYEKFLTHSQLNEVFSQCCEFGVPLRFIVPDMPGFGKSDPLEKEPKDLTPYVDALEQLMKNFQGPTLLGGCSMGGYIALEALARYGGKLSGLLLIDTKHHKDTEDKKNGRIMQAKNLLKLNTAEAGAESKPLSSLISRHPMVAEFVNNMAQATLGKTTKQHKEDIVGLARHLMEQQTIRGIADALKAMAGRRNTGEFLKQYPNPVLVIVGEEDTLTLPEVAKEMADLAQLNTLEILPNVGHLPMIEDTDLFTNKFLQWFQVNFL